MERKSWELLLTHSHRVSSTKRERQMSSVLFGTFHQLVWMGLATLSIFYYSFYIQQGRGLRGPLKRFGTKLICLPTDGNTSAAFIVGPFTCHLLKTNIGKCCKAPWALRRRLCFFLYIIFTLLSLYSTISFTYCTLFSDFLYRGTGTLNILLNFWVVLAIYIHRNNIIITWSFSWPHGRLGEDLKISEIFHFLGLKIVYVSGRLWTCDKGLIKGGLCSQWIMGLKVTSMEAKLNQILKWKGKGGGIKQDGGLI